MNIILSELESKIAGEWHRIQEWITSSYPNHIPPIFSSVDIRQSSVKAAHVDANLFPAGFNNILPDDIKYASLKFRQYVSKYFGNIERILIVPEDFTRNTKYFENIKSLENIIKLAGYDVKFGSSFFEEQMVVSQLDLELNPLTKLDGKVRIKDFTPELILLNNDLMTGVPEILKGISQPIVPSLSLGWYNRRKSNHFRIYNEIVHKLSDVLNFDPWLLSADFEVCANLDFRHKVGLDELAKKVSVVLEKTSKKYSQYNIKDEPYVFIKADNGTYGIGIMSVKNPDEVLTINKKQRHSLDVIKSGVHNSQVIIQEGIPSAIRYDNSSAENMIYSLGEDIISNALRYNADKDNASNLNTHGMQFTSLGRDASHIHKLICELMYIAVSKE